jgi:biotin carboxylase
MRQRLLELGVDQVHYTVVESTEQAVAAVANAGTPCIVKPLDGVGSRGVSLVRSAEEVSPAYDRAAGTDHSWPVIVETYLEGPEFSVEMLVANGQCHPIAITAKYTDSQSFVEIGHVVPAPLATGIEELIYSFCSAVVSALGIERGATHTEVILTDEGPHCVETHVRLGGDDIPRLVEDAASVRLERELAREIIGREYSTEALASPPPARRAAAIWFVPAAGTGILKSVEGIDGAKALEGVQAVDMLLPAGTSVNGIASSHDRIVAVRAVGPDPQTALHRAQAAAETLTVTMDGLPALNIVTA